MVRNPRNTNPLHEPDDEQSELPPYPTIGLVEVVKRTAEDREAEDPE